MVQKKYIFGILLGFCFPVMGQVSEIEEFAFIQPVQISYTWGDFLMKNSCQQDFDQLQKAPFLSLSQQQLKDKMQIYCVNQITAWDTLLSTFRQNKKALLIDEALKKERGILGYIRSLPYFLFWIHNTHPTGDSLTAKLDRIENAIIEKNPQKGMMLMQDLSPQQQLALMPLFNEMRSLTDFAQVLSQGDEQ